MPRARNIKPSFFKNELIGQSDPLLGLLFISLWTLADKSGRLEDRPLRIKAETFPYRENLDVNGYLTQLLALGFIERYKVGNDSIIQIVHFSKHQKPHSTEKPSSLPCNPMVEPITVIVPLNNATACVNSNINVLIPDSLIPDSLIPEKIHTHLSMLLDVGVENQIAKDWLSVRKSKRLPLTQTAFNAISKKITGAGLTINEGIKTCVENGWAGFSAEWLTGTAELTTDKPFVHWWATEEATHARCKQEGIEIISDLKKLRENLNEHIQTKKHNKKLNG